MKSLDELGTALGTDKGSIGQDYLVHYERNLVNLREAEFTMIEIGVANGASLAMWAEYFPKATIVGVDINESCTRFARSNIRIEIGSQADELFMTHIGNKYKPNVIIDDGSHLAAHNMISFRVMFPHLASGGIYVIEDIYLHYPTPSVYTAGADELPADYFAALAVKLAAEDAARAGAGRERNDILSFISRIEFFRRAVLIQKKSEVEPGKIVIEAWPLVEKAKSTYLWHTIGTFVLRNGLELGMAEEAARRAISLAPSSPNNFVRLADVLERQGRIKEALDAALTASVLAADPTQINSLVSRLDARLAGQSNGPAIETP